MNRDAQASFARPVLLVVVLAWLLRLALAAQGGRLAYTDEWRYQTGVKAVHEIAHGHVLEGVRTVIAAGGHAGFAVVSLPPLLVQGALRAALGWRAEETLAAATLWFTLLSALLPAAVFVLGRRLGADPRAALAAAVFCAVSVSLTRYSRHLFPYDASLLLLLSGWAAALAPGRRPGRLFLSGAVVGLGLWAYNGHWALALVVCGAVAARLGLVRDEGPLSRRALRVALVAAGVVSIPLLASALSRLTGADMAERLARHSASMVGGDPREGWLVPWAYFWHSEGPLLPLLLAGAALTLRRDARAGRAPLAAALAVALLLTLSSTVAGLWPVFGRHARSLLPLLALAAACGWLAALRPHPRAAAGLAAAAALAAAFQLAAPFRERFPTDILPVLLRDHPGQIRVFAQNLNQMQPFAEPDLLNPAAPLVFTNPHMPKPVSGHLPSPAGKLLWSATHPCQLAYNHYNGYLPHERALLRREDFRMKLIDTRLPP